ncbi:MAG: D-alanine-D-alanine ligase [Granulosicoccus sp.]|jgi:D-alanine-D-alanine ligase
MKTRVGILMGGYSSESHISEKSAGVVALSIEESFNPILINVSDEGWFAIEGETEFQVDLNSLTYTSGNQQLGFDVIFIAIHGTPGEDGKVQGLLDMIGIPYTGSSVLSSALSFDKGKCNTFLKDCKELNIPNSVVLTKADEPNLKKLISDIGVPCFVKPCNAGSSYGISKVNTEADFLSAIEHAFKFDDDVLVEQFIDGTEVSNGIYSANGVINSLPMTEIVPEGSFFDYEAKYEGSSQEITPARISVELEEKIQAMTRTAFQRLGLNGMARIDYIIQNDVPYLIEANTVPGLSEESILPQQVKEAGMSLGEFFGILIQDALGQAK